jgi:hypothetical protein
MTADAPAKAEARAEAAAAAGGGEAGEGGGHKLGRPPSRKETPTCGFISFRAAAATAAAEGGCSAPGAPAGGAHPMRKLPRAAADAGEVVVVEAPLPPSSTSTRRPTPARARFLPISAARQPDPMRTTRAVERL